MTKPLIEVHTLSRIFRRGEEEIHALQDISFSIASGEFVAITGPSGCGKSSLMYILGLLDAPTSGEYFFEGQNTGQFSDSERSSFRNQKLGFVFQSFHLLPRASALRNVAMPLVYSASYDHGYSKDKMFALAEQALQSVGLATRMTHLPNELSGGERQRVAIARAIVNRPRLLLADEPTGNLDSKSGRDVLDLFGELHAQGVTIVMVTHDSDLATRAHRQLRLFDGRLMEDIHASQ